MLKNNKPWFDDECSKLIDQWKQTKLQWLQNPNQMNGENLKNLRSKTNRTFRNKNIRDLYRGINEFKKGYQPRINIIKDENGNLLADLQNVLNRWKNFFNQVLNVHGVHNVRQDTDS
jgi:hypothetical protein